MALWPIDARIGLRASAPITLEQRLGELPRNGCPLKSRVAVHWDDRPGIRSASLLVYSGMFSCLGLFNSVMISSGACVPSRDRGMVQAAPPLCRELARLGPHMRGHRGCCARPAWHALLMMV